MLFILNNGPEVRPKLVSAAARQACQSSLPLNLSRTILTKCENLDAKKPQLSLRLLLFGTRGQT